MFYLWVLNLRENLKCVDFYNGNYIKINREGKYRILFKWYGLILNKFILIIYIKLLCNV